ncbi:uncharacterized protein VP01_943g1 [Puccinia sorghi]|uniref:J domain-containing protein n=1 Tax=Puccinia sorghi TaxID=27349 RepID=A0A0L6U8P8_9BASI|nr:uncharacterized protein VP01_943g1 [Puccinia sorghi]
MTADMDCYSIVGVSVEADSNQITSAYRKASLKVHPDRNPDDPLAAEKFQRLKTAFEVLTDPIKRAELDAKRAAQAARTARFAGLDNKRKALARDLEMREEALLNAHSLSQEKAAKIRKLDEIKAAGARLRQAKIDQLAADLHSHQTLDSSDTFKDNTSKDNTSKHNTSKHNTLDSAVDNPLDNTLDCTLRFKWARKRLPELNTVHDLTSRICACDLIKASDIESVVMSAKPPLDSAPDNPGPSANKKLSAVVCFKTTALCNRFFDLAQADPAWTRCAVTRLKPSS